MTPSTSTSTSTYHSSLSPHILRLQHRIQKIVDGIDKVAREAPMTSGAMLRGHLMQQSQRWEWVRSAVRYIPEDTMRVWEQQGTDILIIAEEIEGMIGSRGNEEIEAKMGLVYAAANGPIDPELEAAFQYMERHASTVPSSSTPFTPFTPTTEAP